jgi:hypothetical protein
MSVMSKRVSATKGWISVGDFCQDVRQDSTDLSVAKATRNMRFQYIFHIARMHNYKSFNITNSFLLLRDATIIRYRDTSAKG